MKNAKKTMCVFLSLLFLMSVMPVSAYSVKETGYLTSDYITYEFGYDNSNGCTATVPSYNSQYPMTGNFYDQLSATQKEIYNVILASSITTTQLSVSLNNPIEFTASVAPPSSGNDPVYEPISDAIVGAYFSLIRDCPERFWYYGISYGWSTSYYQSGSLYYYEIDSISLTIGFHPSYTAATIEPVYANLMSAVNNFTPKGVTRYEKLRSIHDYIVTKATYDPNYNNSNAAAYGHQPTGCLLAPYICVCEGYAEAFKLFADKIGVPCVLVTSLDHIWNVVLMEDGKWYAIDCTWDDPSSGSTSTNYLCYNFFLVGSQTITDRVSATFASEHVEEAVYTSSTGVSLTNPTLSTTSYSGLIPVTTVRTDGTQGNDHPGGSIDKMRMLVFIIPGTILPALFTGQYGGYSWTGNYQTGSTVKYTSEVGDVENYTLIMRGDVDKDADSDAQDIAKALNMCVGTEKYSSTAPETYAADVNNDGVVDGFDVAIIDRAQNGKYSYY